MYNQGLEKAPHRQYGSAEPQPQLDHDHLSFSSHGNGGNDQIINVLCIHNSVQKGRKPNCPQAVQPPKRDCRQAYSVCLWLKSNYRLRAGMILPYSRITMTLNMSQFYHQIPYYFQRGINGKSGDRITETHLMVSDWGPGSFLLQLLSSLFYFFHFQPLTWLQGCVGLLVDPPNIKYLNSYWMDCLKLCTDICSPRRIKPADFGALFNTSCNATSRSNQQKSSEISQHPQTDRYNLVQTSIVPRRWRHWSPLILPPPIRRSTFVVEYCNIWVAMKFHTDIHTSLGINCCTFHGSWTPPSVITGSKV